jgi:phospholipid/cholesterol/gamma-HCH transport system ATP-binding protein
MVDGELPVLEMRGVCKAFDGKVVLDGASISVFEGETLAIIGASGGGKSVALRIMTGLMEADEGEVLYRGRPINSFGPRELADLRKELAYVFQEDALFDSMTVLENVGYALVEHTTQSDAEIEARAWECLDLVGLGRDERPNILSMMPTNLSGGMRRRVALARAIALIPKVVLYDEPMGGLDPANCRRIADMCKNLQQQYGLTSVVVTHHLPSVWQIADRVAMLEGARFTHIAPTPEFRKIDDPEFQAFISPNMDIPASWAEAFQSGTFMR